MEKLIENIEKGIKEKCTPSIAYGIINGEKISTGAVGSMTYNDFLHNINNMSLSNKYLNSFLFSI